MLPTPSYHESDSIAHAVKGEWVPIPPHPPCFLGHLVVVPFGPFGSGLFGTGYGSQVGWLPSPPPSLPSPSLALHPSR